MKRISGIPWYFIKNLVGKQVSDSEDCCICLNVLKKKGTITLSACNHKIHRSCMKKNIRVNNLCPLCRKKLSEEECISLLVRSKQDKVLKLEYSVGLDVCTNWHQNGCANGTLLQEGFENSVFAKIIRHLILHHFKRALNTDYQQYFFFSETVIDEIAYGYVVGAAQCKFSVQDWHQTFFDHPYMPAPISRFHTVSENDEIIHEVLLASMSDMMHWADEHALI